MKSKAGLEIGHWRGKAKHPILLLCLLTGVACSREDATPSSNPTTTSGTGTESSPPAETSGPAVPRPTEPGSPAATDPSTLSQPHVQDSDSTSSPPTHTPARATEDNAESTASSPTSAQDGNTSADLGGPWGGDATRSSGAAEPETQAPNLPAVQPVAESISFGTTLNPSEVMAAARQLAHTSIDVDASSWRAKGDQHRTYRFAATDTDEPYRLYVPSGWDGQTTLPMVMFLHGSGSDENTYVDQNDKQMIELAEQHGFILVSPRGGSGAYGNFLRLSAPFGNPASADELMAQVTPESRRSNELSEMDVINVIELVLAEYPVNHSAMYLTGHSMGSGGAWYIGGKYSTYWRAIAPMSGPFVQEGGYPWDNLLNVGILVTEGTNTPSLDSSRLLGTWLSERDFDAEYKEMNADHGGMVSLVLPDVFAFFADRSG